MNEKCCLAESEKESLKTIMNKNTKLIYEIEKMLDKHLNILENTGVIEESEIEIKCMIEEMIYQNSRLEITLNKLKRFGERFIG